jgi:para-aminobenzoate synthetase component 1
MHANAAQSACTPADVLAAWPADRPLAVLWSGGGAPRLRHTCLAEPVAACRLIPSEAGCGSGEWHVPGRAAALTRNPLRDLESLLKAHQRAPRARPCASGWIAALSYDLGALIEPAVHPSRPLRHNRSQPLIDLRRVEHASLFDHRVGEWITPPPDAEPPNDPPHRSEAVEVGPLSSGTGRAAYETAVARAVEYIHAGDVFQVNLAHRLQAAFQGSTRAFFARLLAAARPWHGAYIESPPTTGSPGHPGSPRSAVLSASPELFLDYDPASRRVTTRPMKGTRPDTGSPTELALSPKDRAELNMIIDLMRNDLGRVCAFGSVRVDEPRVIEPHGGVWQAVGTVSGTLRDGVGPADLLAAAFPPGSVTGAPKIRAMQIIDELEPEPRGTYCGCIGWFGDDGRIMLNVAIRTVTIEGHAPAAAHDLGRIDRGVLRYSVGAGIVADSDPAAEWRETMDKARVLHAAIGCCDQGPP